MHARRSSATAGATGYLDTDYAAKGRYAVAAVANHDLVCVHVEAPDEASHEGKADAKVAALERIDVPLTVVGEIERRPGIRFRQGARTQRLKKAGYEHFR